MLHIVVNKVSLSMTEATQSNTVLLPDRKVCERYGVTKMTLFRWDNKPELNFPKPVVIQKRKYRYLHELEDFERARVKSAVAA